jgi:hypothetical protein
MWMLSPIPHFIGSSPSDYYIAAFFLLLFERPSETIISLVTEGKGENPKDQPDIPPNCKSEIIPEHACIYLA